MKVLLFALLFTATVHANAQSVFAQGGILRGNYSTKDAGVNPDPLKGLSFQFGARFRKPSLKGNFGFQASIGYEYFSNGSKPSATNPNNDKELWHYHYINIRPGISYQAGLEQSFCFLASANVSYNIGGPSPFGAANFDVGAGYSGAMLVCSYSKGLSAIFNGFNSLVPNSFFIGLRLYPEFIF